MGASGRPGRSVPAFAVFAFAVIAPLLVGPPAWAQWSAAVGIERFDWSEDTSPIVVHEHGPRFSMAVGWMLPREQGLLFAYRGEVYGGNVTYNGSFLLNPTKPATGNATYLGTTQAAQLRWRWAGRADAVAGLEYETWERRLSTTQEERYRVVSLRLGAEHLATARHPIVGGGGVRLTLANSEEATLEYSGVPYHIDLEPGRGTNLYLHAGYRVAPRLTLVGYWDGLHLGRSNTVALAGPSGSTLYVWQPASEMWRLGIRAVYEW